MADSIVDSNFSNVLLKSLTSWKHSGELDKTPNFGYNKGSLLLPSDLNFSLLSPLESTDVRPSIGSEYRVGSVQKVQIRQRELYMKKTLMNENPISTREDEDSTFEQSIAIEEVNYGAASLRQNLMEGGKVRTTCPMKNPFS